jgi:RND family efflux transporter MFP subunit
VVTDILETSGSFPDVGDPLMRISDLSWVQVLLGVSPGQREELSEGQEALLSSDSIQGRVTRIALQADPESRLIEVEVTFPGAEDGSGAPTAVPGTLATVEIVVGARDSTLQVPATALQNGNVWVVDADGVARRRTVQVGLRGNGSVEILQGLEAGEEVVTAGASLLSDGVRARVVGG